MILNTAIPQKMRIPQPRSQGLWERGCKYRDTEKNVGKPRNTSIPSATRCHTEATTLYRDSIEALSYGAVIFRWFDIAFFLGPYLAFSIGLLPTFPWSYQCENYTSF